MTAVSHEGDALFLSISEVTDDKVAQPAVSSRLFKRVGQQALRI